MKKVIPLIFMIVIAITLTPGCDVLDAIKITPTPSPTPSPTPASTPAPTPDPIVGAIKQSDNPALYNAIVAFKGTGIDANHDSILQASELDTITGPLDLGNKGITDISGIQYCGNLVTLSLGNVNSTTPNDITVMPQDLSGMTSLNDLDLFNNPDLHSCPNLSALATIPNVRNINLTNTGITDFGFLAPESSPSPLYWLCINDNNLTTADLQTLADNASKFPNLKDLYFSQNGSLGDGAVPIVAGAFPHLKMLAMGGCGLTDVSGLSAMTDVTYLVVDRNNLTSLNGLQSLTNLSVLMPATMA